MKYYISKHWSSGSPCLNLGLASEKADRLRFTHVGRDAQTMQKSGETWGSSVDQLPQQYVGQVQKTAPYQIRRSVNN